MMTSLIPLIFIITILLIWGRIQGENQVSQEEVKLTIGYQVPTAQTWGSIILKQNDFLKNELERKFPSKKFTIEWFNASSGVPLINGMVSKKIDIMFLGDMPALIAGEKGQTLKGFHPELVAIDGRGVDGENQAIIANKDIKTPEDLKGKKIAVPLGSSSHRLLLEYMESNNLDQGVKIEFKDLAVAIEDLNNNRVAAVAAWEPFPTIAKNNPTIKIIYDGKNSKHDYLSGVVINKDTVSKEYKEAFLNALDKAHRYIKNNKENSVELISKETKFESEVVENVISQIKFDSKITDKDINTFNKSKQMLIKIGKIEDYEFSKFIE